MAPKTLNYSITYKNADNLLSPIDYEDYIGFLISKSKAIPSRNDLGFLFFLQKILNKGNAERGFLRNIHVYQDLIKYLKLTKNF